MPAELLMADAQRKSAVRSAVAGFGGLGLIPFVLPLLAPVLAPTLMVSAGRGQVVYGGIILSFLGGARFGRAVEEGGLLLDVALSMGPPLLAFCALLLPQGAGRLFLIASLLGQLCWDAATPGLPSSYRATRAILTAVAVAALGAGLVVFR